MVIIDRGHDCAQKIQRNPLINFLYFSKAAEYKVRNTKIYSIYINNKENKISKRIAFSFKKHVI